MLYPKTFVRMRRGLLFSLLLIPLFLALPAGPAFAKTLWCNGMEDLRVYIRNAEGEDVYIKYYSKEDVINDLLAGDDQIVYYSSVDAAGMAILGAAQGISVKDFISRVKADLAEDYPDTDFHLDADSTVLGIKAVDGMSKIATPYSARIGCETETPSARYYYPYMFENFQNRFEFEENPEYLSLATADKVEVPNTLAICNYQERVGDGRDYLPDMITNQEELEAAKAIVAEHLNYDNSIRYVFGITPEDLIEDLSPASDSTKWINRIYLIPETPVDYASLGKCADPEVIDRGYGPGRYERSFNLTSATPNAQIHYSVDQLPQIPAGLVLGPTRLYEGGTVAVDLLNNSFGTIIRSPYDVTPTNWCRIKAQTSKIGYTDSDLLRDDSFREQIPPILTADTTDNTVGRSIEITFEEDADWRAAILGIVVDGSIVDPSLYSVTEGKITLDAAAFPQVKNYTLTVKTTSINGNGAYLDTTVTQPILADAGTAGVGDINGDGSVGIQDVLLSIDYMMGKTTPDGDQLSSADLNGDGGVGIQDVLEIIDKMMGE